jgi:hypothetical protein
MFDFVKEAVAASACFQKEYASMRRLLIKLSHRRIELCIRWITLDSGLKSVVQSLTTNTLTAFTAV